MRASCSTMLASSGVAGGACVTVDSGVDAMDWIGSLVEARANLAGGVYEFGISGILSATLAVVSTRIGLGARFSPTDAELGVSLVVLEAVFAGSGAATDFGRETMVFVGGGWVARTATGVFGVGAG